MADDAEIRITANTDDFDSAMRRSKDAADEVTKAMHDGFQRVGEPLEELKEKLNAAFQVTGIAAMLEGLLKLREAMDQIAEKAVHLEHAAMMLGLSTKELQGLHAAAEEAGVGTERMDAGLTMLALRMQEARDGSEAMQSKLAKVGITLDDLRNSNFTAADAAYKLAASHASAGEKMDVVGRRGIALLAALKELEGGQQGAIDKAEQLGALNTDQIESLGAYHKAVADLTIKFENFAGSLASDASPALVKFTEILERVWNEGLKPMADVLIIVGKYFVDLVGSIASGIPVLDAFKLIWEALAEVSKVVASAWVIAQTAVTFFIAAALGGIKEVVEFVAKLAAAVMALAEHNFRGAADIGKSAFTELGDTFSSIMNGWNDQANKLGQTLTNIWKGPQEAMTEVVVNIHKQGNEDLDVKTKQAPVEFGGFDEQLMFRMSEEGQKLNAQLQKQFDKISPQIDLTESEGKVKLALARFEEMEKGLTRLFDPIARSFESALTGIITHTETLQQALRKIWNSILQEFVRIAVQMAERWAITEIMKTSVTQTHSLLRIAMEKLGLVQEASASATSVSEKKAEALSIIPGEAAVAAGGAAAAMASIPYVGPALAAAAWAETFALVMSGMGAVSAAGGFDIPSGVNPLVQAHAGEMILPSSLSDGIRSMIAGGGASGGDIHLHVHAVDGKSVERLFDNHSDVLARVLRREFDTFNRNLR